MKILKILIGIIVILAVIIGILSLVAPTKMDVSREIVIVAPKTLVYNNISHFSKMNQWSPWNKRDPNMQVTLEGSDGTVGSKSSWKGNDKVGEGSQTIDKLEENRIESTLNFIKPFESTATGYFDVKEDPDGTRVKWGLLSSMPRPFNVMGLFMDMDAEIGKDFEEGLNSLKELCEKENAAAMAAQQEILDLAAANATDSTMVK
jgi:hypothetical protein